MAARLKHFSPITYLLFFLSVGKFGNPSGLGPEDCPFKSDQRDKRVEDNKLSSKQKVVGSNPATRV